MIVSFIVIAIGIVNFTVAIWKGSYSTLMRVYVMI